MPNNKKDWRKLNEPISLSVLMFGFRCGERQLIYQVWPFNIIRLFGVRSYDEEVVVSVTEPTSKTEDTTDRCRENIVIEEHVIQPPLSHAGSQAG